MSQAEGLDHSPTGAVNEVNGPGGSRTHEDEVRSLAPCPLDYGSFMSILLFDSAPLPYFPEMLSVSGLYHFLQVLVSADHPSTYSFL